MQRRTVKTPCPPNREIRNGLPNSRVRSLASHLAPGVARPIQQSRDGFLHEQRLTTVPQACNAGSTPS
jgi:hypothetical protein